MAGISYGFRGVRRYLVAVSVTAAAAGGLVLAGATAGSAAPSAPANSPAASRVITLTGSTSSSAGHLTMRLKYQLLSAGKFKVLSFTYSGGTSVHFAHPVLLLSFQPAAGPGQVVRKSQINVRVMRPVILKLSDAGKFSGTVPLKDLPKLNWKVNGKHKMVPGPGILIESSVASLQQKPRNLYTTPGLQVGLVYGPVF